MTQLLSGRRPPPLPNERLVFRRYARARGLSTLPDALRQVGAARQRILEAGAALHRRAPRLSSYSGARSRILFSVTAPFNPAAATCPPSAIGRKSANTSPLSARARPRASRRRKSKTVAGGQGRAVVDRSADPVREKCPDPHGCPGRRDRGKHQGVGLDDAGAGGRGWRPDRGPRQDTRRPAARHRRDPGDGRRGLERGAEARLRAGGQSACDYRIGVGSGAAAAVGRRVKAPTLPLPRRVRAPARESARKIKDRGRPIRSSGRPPARRSRRATRSGAGRRRRWWARTAD